MKTLLANFLFGLVVCPLVALSQITETKIKASDGGEADYFGWSVSISGDRTIVGASSVYHDGAAYVYRREGTQWVLEAKLINDGVGTFGSSVSISGDYAIVSDVCDSARVYRREGVNWIEEAALFAFDGTALNCFAHRVFIFGDRALATATNESVYVFRREGTEWVGEARLGASDGPEPEIIGVSASMSEDRVILGVFLNDARGKSSGSAYVFRRDGIEWVEEIKLRASDATAFDYFGGSVSISGDYAIVGATGDDDNGDGSGSVYVFRREGFDWIEEAKLTASDGAADDHFGTSVSLSGDYAVVGTRDDDDKGISSGSAYIFKREGTSWTEEGKLTASDGAAYDAFGQSVSISGDYAVAGAYFDDDTEYDQGSAYISSGFSTTLCADMTSMVARCIGGDTKTVQVRVNLLNNIIHAGEPVTITIDGTPFTATIISNGTHSRANFSIPGWTVGTHTVSLVDPAGCLADQHPECVAGDGLAKADPYWNDDAEWTVAAQEVPQATELLGNYPNPFNPTTGISYQLSTDGLVVLKVYNMLGQLVATVVDENKQAGYHNIIWDGSNDFGQKVASGIYMYQLSAGTFVETKRMLLLR